MAEIVIISSEHPSSFEERIIFEIIGSYIQNFKTFKFFIYEVNNNKGKINHVWNKPPTTNTSQNVIKAHPDHARW